MPGVWISMDQRPVCACVCDRLREQLSLGVQYWGMQTGFHPPYQLGWNNLGQLNGSQVSRVCSGPQRGGHMGWNTGAGAMVIRSEERRVGKECRSRWSPH